MIGSDEFRRAAAQELSVAFQTEVTASFVATVEDVMRQTIFKLMAQDKDAKVTTGLVIASGTITKDAKPNMRFAIPKSVKDCLGTDETLKQNILHVSAEKARKKEERAAEKAAKEAAAQGAPNAQPGNAPVQGGFPGQQQGYAPAPNQGYAPPPQQFQQPGQAMPQNPNAAPGNAPAPGMWGGQAPAVQQTVQQPQNFQQPSGTPGAPAPAPQTESAPWGVPGAPVPNPGNAPAPAPGMPWGGQQ